ncbi:MAG: hypothetical protein K0R29_95 [Pseudobdellovibrio sp.]|jgi:hypothetical protein|nr:hypothetical protein [Pseudobdellovibrio sp.]
MSYEFYKIIHLTGLVLLFSGLVTLLSLKVAGVTLEGTSKKFAFLTHGIGLLFLLVSGFGLLARLGMVNGLPNWVYVKLAVWLFFGGIVALIKRKNVGWSFYTILLCVFMLAGYVAITKPF